MVDYMHLCLLTVVIAHKSRESILLSGPMGNIGAGTSWASNLLPSANSAMDLGECKCSRHQRTGAPALGSAHLRLGMPISHGNVKIIHVLACSCLQSLSRPLPSTGPPCRSCNTGVDLGFYRLCARQYILQLNVNDTVLYGEAAARGK